MLRRDCLRRTHHYAISLGTKLFDIAADIAAWNAAQTEEMDVRDFEEMLIDDVELAEWVTMG
jgi:hypothetical protein